MQLAYTMNDVMAYLQTIYRAPKIPDGQGGMMDGGPARLLITPYAYPITFSALAQGATQTAQVPIQANSDFFLMGLQARANIGTAQTVSNETLPFVRMLIVDSGSNEQYTFSAIDLSNYATFNNVVKTLPWPRLVNGRSVLTVSITSYAPTAETLTTLDISFEGVLVRAMDS